MQSTEKGFVKCVWWHEVSDLLQGKAAILTSPLPAGYLSGDRALAASCCFATGSLRSCGKQAHPRQASATRFGGSERS